MNTARWLVRVTALALTTVAPAMTAQGGDASGDLLPGTVEIRRTTDDIPHIRAANWRDLGFGYGYVQAQDALCTLAEAFVTYEGRRSLFFGAQARPTQSSTFGRSRNIDLDFFFRATVPSETVEQFQRAQPAELIELIEGFAAGYNHFLRAARENAGAGKVRQDAPSCLGAQWLREIGSRDIIRRVIAANLAAGYLRFVSEITNARPPAAQKSQQSDGLDAPPRRLSRVGEHAHLGSNMMAFGGRATNGSESVLLGNPHWYWGGPDRFYQAHLTIPGTLNVAGASLLGIPVIMIGFNDHVAWSHTVSAARRFGLFALSLAPGQPTRYRLDGDSVPMQAVTLSVEVSQDGQTTKAESRTLYRTRFGLVVNLERYAPSLGWGTEQALAIRDINAGNVKVLRNFFYWNQARSLSEFIAIQRREAAMPWVDTVAIGRGDGHVWYSDIGAVPNVSDAQRERCPTSLSKPFAALDALAPVLDGSRTVCDWPNEPGATLEGTMPPERLPQLLREDYVANMNDSYWLSNLYQPLEGFPSILGGERQALSLRGREGHRIALQLLRSGPMSSLQLTRRLQRAALGSRSYAADEFKEQLLRQACVSPEVELSPDTLKSLAIGLPASTVDIAKACQVLRRWRNTAFAQDRGALLWDVFWRRLEMLPQDSWFRVHFDAQSPLSTPAHPNAGDAHVRQALGAAVVALNDKKIPLDAPLGSAVFIGKDANRVPLYGGCLSGYFTIVCGNGGFELDRNTHGNSYLQVVRFGEKGVDAYTFLAHGQQERALDDPAHDTALVRYAERRWLHFPFDEQAIERDAGLHRMVLKPLE